MIAPEVETEANEFAGNILILPAASYASFVASRSVLRPPRSSVSLRRCGSLPEIARGPTSARRAHPAFTSEWAEGVADLGIGLVTKKSERARRGPPTWSSARVSRRVWVAVGLDWVSRSPPRRQEHRGGREALGGRGRDVARRPSRRSRNGRRSGRHRELNSRCSPEAGLALGSFKLSNRGPRGRVTSLQSTKGSPL